MGIATRPRSAEARKRRRNCGATLLELLFTLAVVSTAAAMAGSAIRGLSRATTVETARLRTLATLLAARRRAYSDEATVQVDVAGGTDALTLRNPDGTNVRVALPAGTTVAHSVAAGRVRFFASGLADNATIVLADTEALQQATVVVNQRALVR
jgi:type II secretory pathway pseudopilin PulG